MSRRELERLHERVLALELNTANLINIGKVRGVCILHANIGKVRVNGTDFREVSSGEDGEVIMAVPQTAKSRTYVIKVFKCPTVDAKDQPEMDSIVLDQARREVTCLTLLKGHPNVPRLISKEVDTCTLLKDGVPHPKSVLIRQEYIKNLRDITNEKLEVLGLNQDPVDKMYYVDYNDRNRLVQYVWGQAASLTCALSERGIYHRDVDDCNFMIQMPELRLVLLDFMRAEVPQCRAWLPRKT